MPRLQIGQRGRIVAGCGGDDPFHYFPIGLIVVGTTRPDGIARSFQVRSVDGSMSTTGSETQWVRPSDVELLEGEEEVTTPTTPLTLQIGQEVRVVSGFQEDEHGHCHYFPSGSIVRVMSRPNSDGRFDADMSTSRGEGRMNQIIYLYQVETLEGERSPMPPRHTCANCGEDDGGRCENCGICYDCNGTCREENCDNCRECCSCANDNVIQECSCRDYPVRNPSPAPSQDFLYLGVELEVEASGDNEREEVAERIKRKHASQLLIKDDGSLHNGFEMVSGPCSLEVHQTMWPSICETAIKAGARSWKHSTTGLHVHMSRKFFTPLTLGKLLVFMNSEHTRPNIVRLAGRESHDYAAMAKKKLTDIFHRKSHYNWQTDRTTYTLDRTALNGTSHNRYEALNLTPEKTIEARIFKGTLDVVHVLANIEFCHAACHHMRDCSIAQCESWTAFYVYVCQHKKLYPNLIKYMSVRPDFGPYKDSEKVTLTATAKGK